MSAKQNTENNFNSMIALLPKYVLLKLLRDYLYLVEIGKLDSALCNHESRPFFQRHLNDCELIFCHDHANSSEVGLVSWIVSRKIHVSSLFLKEESMGLPNNVDFSKNHTLNSLKQLKVACGPGYKSFSELISWAVNLESLDIINASSISLDTLRPILNMCSQNLKILTLSGADISDWTLSNISFFANSCINLAELNLMKCVVSSVSMNRMLNKLFLNRVHGRLLKFTLQDHILAAERTPEVDIFLYYIRKSSSFEVEVLRYVPLNANNEKVIVWEKVKSECGTNFTNIVTATNNKPNCSSYIFIAHSIKTLVWDGFKELNCIECMRQVPCLYINNCVLAYKTCWIHYCTGLVELHIKDSRIVCIRSPGSPSWDAILLTSLCFVSITDSTFHNAALWLEAIAKTATSLLKQITINVPEAEMYGTFSDVLTERLAVLGTNVTHTVRI